MSSYSEQVRVALYAKMNVSGVTDLATGGIFFKIARTDASYPFIVFDYVPMSVEWAMQNNLAGERHRYFIKAIADKSASTTKDPSEVCEDILAACETAIGNSLTVSGRTVSRVQRVADIPPIVDDTGYDKQVWQHGFQLEVFIS